ncbi:MAG: hypothetical protein C4523_04585 [Myxococcales bacterium]|nr:MAG: hypothetical protein C4523_04585 [Myxococcales bacterium]
MQRLLILFGFVLVLGACGDDGVVVFLGDAEDIQEDGDADEQPVDAGDSDDEPASEEASDGDRSDGDLPDGDSIAADGDSTETDDDLVEDETVESIEADADGDGAEPLCLVLSDARLATAGADGVWSPGEAVLISVTLSNICDEDYMHYPGVSLESDTPGIETGGSGLQLYGILAGQSIDGEFLVTADVSLTPGDPAAFTARVTALGCGEPDADYDCPPPAPYEFSFELAAPVVDAPLDCLHFSGFALRPYIGSPAGRWEPGDEVAAEVVMRNDCEENFWAQPGARLSADQSGVRIDAPLYLPYDLGPGMSAPLAWAVTADRRLDSGLVVRFTVLATTNGCDGPEATSPDCPAPNPITMDRTLGDLLDPRE